MSENPKQKGPLGRFLKNFIGGLILSYAVWAVVLICGFNENASIVRILLRAIIPGVVGAIGYVLMKLYTDWLYTHFVFFTRSPFMFLLNKYIINPLISVIGFPFLILLLMENLKG